MDTTNQAAWETPTPEEKRRVLYDRQVATLKTFLEHGVITRKSGNLFGGRYKIRIPPPQVERKSYIDRISSYGCKCIGAVAREKFTLCPLSHCD